MINLRMKLMKKINVDNLSAYLHTKNISHEDRDYEKVTDVVKVTFSEDDKRDWGGFAPKITIEYEELMDTCSTLLWRTTAVRRRRILSSMRASSRPSSWTSSRPPRFSKRNWVPTTRRLGERSMRARRTRRNSKRHLFYHVYRHVPGRFGASA